MLLKLSRKSQELTKEAFLGKLVAGGTKALAKGTAGAGMMGAKAVGKPLWAALKTRPGRAIIGTAGLSAGMGAEGFRRGSGVMHMQNPRGNPFTAVRDTFRGASDRFGGAIR